MAAPGNGVLPNAEPIVLQGENANPQRGGTDPLRRATDWLEDNNKVMLTFQRHIRYRRYALLRMQHIFNALVQLYQNVFSSHWHQLRRTVEHYQIPAHFAQSPWTYVAHLYISVWVVDLYASIRRACQRVCPEAYNEYFTGDFQQVIFEYDTYLSTLLSMIRPTVVNLVHETTLFVPKPHEEPNFNVNDMNIFNLEGFEYNENIVHGVISIIRDRKLIKLDKPLETGFGRPFWLFDWHSSGHAYAWFPTENNYDMRDVTVAYVLGVACTPKLGPRDIDEWQYFPANVLPREIRASDYARERQVAYHGAVEVTTIQTQSWSIPQGVRDAIEVILPPRQGLPAPPAAAAPPQPPQPPQQQQQQGAQLIALPPKRGRAKKARVGPSSSNVNVTVTDDIDMPEQADPAGAEPIPLQPGREAAPAVEPQAHGAEQPAPPPAPAEATITYRRINRYRLITYSYFHQVTDNEDLHSRLAGLRQINSLM
ncbi:coat protein [Cucumis melo cryptic virus]|nr:coat protein [Cucumis melo cryptic virus]